MLVPILKEEGLDKTKKVMQKVLKEIQSGKFAREWMKENKKGRADFLKMRADQDKHQIEEVGKRLRGMMSWIKK